MNVRIIFRADTPKINHWSTATLGAQLAQTLQCCGIDDCETNWILPERLVRQPHFVTITSGSLAVTTALCKTSDVEFRTRRRSDDEDAASVQAKVSWRAG